MIRYRDLKTLALGTVIAAGCSAGASAARADADQHRGHRQGSQHQDSHRQDRQHQDNGEPTPANASAPAASRTPIPALTDADRSAAFLTDGTGHTLHDKAIVGLLLLDRVEWQHSDDGNALAWDISGWAGNDIDRVWLRAEGERSDGTTEQAEAEILWGHAIGPWWDIVAGARHDFAPGASQTWGALGLQGLALYGFEVHATAYLGAGGQTAARLGGEYDLLITNRLILQPGIELNAHGDNDPQRGIGAGVSSLEIGLRLRYEIRREFAPYLGVSWNRLYGNTAELARDRGADTGQTQLVVGFRAWF